MLYVEDIAEDEVQCVQSEGEVSMEEWAFEDDVAEDDFVNKKPMLQQRSLRKCGGGFVENGSSSVGPNRSWKSMEIEIESLLEKLLDINDAMSRCAASAASTTSITQKLARHRDILHEYSQTFFDFIAQGSIALGSRTVQLAVSVIFSGNDAFPAIFQLLFLS
ncbi:Golgi SNAP receptor complex member 1-2 [Platanthera guangdongensis]|uniref:Golgi SNAP receptor complex member 1-2 n=1 Tax=Platanthera guangdongensis TaxID=2320717 RepID=A0ABR2MKT1_9ASPA